MPELWQRSAAGIGEPERMIKVEAPIFGIAWTPDGTSVATHTAPGLSAARDILGFGPGLDAETSPLVALEFDRGSPAFSPDGRWVAYESDKTGRYEVFVRPYPDVDSSRFRVSTDGGQFPTWAHSGDELFYLNVDGEVVAARLEVSSEVRVVGREILFGLDQQLTPGAFNLTIHPDDSRFLMGHTLEEDQFETRWILVQNWLEELSQRMGSN